MLLFPFMETHAFQLHHLKSTHSLCRACKFLNKVPKNPPKKQPVGEQKTRPNSQTSTQTSRNHLFSAGWLKANSSTLYTRAGTFKTHKCKRIIFLMALICCALRGPRFTGSGPPPSVQRTGLLSGWEEAALWWEKINPPLTSGGTPARGAASGTFAGRWEGEKGRVQFASSRSASVGWGKRMRALLLMHLFIFFSQATNRKSKAGKKGSVSLLTNCLQKRNVALWVSHKTPFHRLCHSQEAAEPLQFCTARIIIIIRQSVLATAGVSVSLHHSCLWNPSSEVAETRSNECCIQRHSGLTWKVSLFQRKTDWNRYEIWIGAGGMKERSVRESRQDN